MKKTIGIIILVLIGVITYFILTSEEITYNRDVTLNQNIGLDVVNYSNIEFADTLMYLALDELGVKDTKVVIYTGEPSVLKSILTGVMVDGFVIKDTFFKKYDVHLNSDMNKRDLVDIISHEAVHIEQDVSGRFSADNFPIIYFEGKFFNIHLLPYSLRPWEREAYNKQDGISSEVRKKVWN